MTGALRQNPHVSEEENDMSHVLKAASQVKIFSVASAALALSGPCAGAVVEQALAAD
jgi:hypothetical protein